MKFFWVWSLGAMCGSLGTLCLVMLRSMIAPSKNRCRFITEKMLFIPGGGQKYLSARCDSDRSNICSDGLCPVHCKEVHGKLCIGAIEDVANVPRL